MYHLSLSSVEQFCRNFLRFCSVIKLQTLNNVIERLCFVLLDYLLLR